MGIFREHSIKYCLPPTLAFQVVEFILCFLKRFWLKEGEKKRQNKTRSRAPARRGSQHECHVRHSSGHKHFSKHILISQGVVIIEMMAQNDGCHSESESGTANSYSGAVSQNIMFSLELSWDESMLFNTLVNSVGSKWPHPESILCRSQSHTLLYPGHCQCFRLLSKIQTKPQKMVDLQVPTEVVVGRSEIPGLYQAGLMGHSQ